MRWRFRNARLAHGCEFAAQDRDDFFAEDVDLFEHCLLWQARVVDEEQLALVVTGPVAEAEGAFDDLLRAADCQRCLRGELFQAGPMAVDGGVVEVGAEFIDRIL